MNVLDADEPEVLHAVFSFLDEWEAESKATSETTSSQAAQPTAPPIKRPRSRRGRDLQKQELLRLREEVPVLERRLKSLQSARARHEAANCDASRVIALAARELRAGRPDPANGNLLLVWKEMAKRYQRLRKEAGNENRALRNHIAHQLRTIESLQKLKSTLHPTNTSLGLVYLRSNKISSPAARNTLAYLSTLLTNQVLETDEVFRLRKKPTTTTASEVTSEILSSTKMHLEVLHCCYLPFQFQFASKAFWKICHKCHGVVLDEQENTLTNSFASTYASNELSFTMNGFSTMRMHENSKQSVFVSSSMYELMLVLDKTDPGVNYSEKSWFVFEPVQSDAELCILRSSARISIEVDNRLPERERYRDLVFNLLLEQKKQELDAARLGIESELLHINRQK